ncbi:Ig-like domain-containing protein [Paenibacillus sp. WQ 127069]|uniref:Ig-like domain-containing protein n=1 Tax=Paenibacillus baimaensis TaxID=2982185 RepID=A0ABT2UCP7_9BACL|nr:Ig-like domain-containing protein [Paenibacillus sp. WQ 127069]MCU6792406.1 Ig-like domain-containing protein [Paenibacillus sp. WQ 127069]
MTRSIETMMDFFLREKGELIHINGVKQTALIRDAVDKIQLGDEKIVRAATLLHIGDFIDYRNERYLITSEIDHNKQSYRSRIRKCNYNIAFNWNGNVKWFDAIVEGKTFSIDDGKMISMPEGTIHVYLQDNADTRAITLSQRFYNTHQPFKVEGIDRTVNGIIKLSCSLGSISTPYDDVENNIADRWKYEASHTYALTIDNGTTANVLINDILQLNCTVIDDDHPISNPSITFSSSDPSVVSVDNEGKVMGIEAGQAMITARLTYYPDVQDTIQITTVETMTHTYTISLTGNPTIKIGQSTSYVSHIYDNGTEVFDQSVQWSLRNQEDTTPIMGSITASTGNSSTVKAGSSSGYINKYIVLIATLTSDPTITIEKMIQLKSLL